MGETRDLFISKAILVVLFTYYVGLFVGSLGVFFFLVALNYHLSLDLFPILVFSLLSSLLGTSLYYLRKLYKDCLTPNKILTDSGSFQQKLATAIYFFSRPLFSSGLTILLIISIKAGVDFITIPESALDPHRFIYFCIFVSFVSGFTVGKGISKIESYVH